MVQIFALNDRPNGGRALRRRFWWAAALVSSEEPDEAPRYFVWVDVLRGLAALAIVIFHYQHFYYAEAARPTLGDPALQPFFAQLRYVYTYGASAVQLFWAISGFVFANTYASRAKIASLRTFAVSRFARLYPLHFVTLIVVAALQIVSMQLLGHFQIYPENDPYHFMLNLFFASSWGFERGFSFNAPIWSVSIEVLIYAVFFGVLHAPRRRAVMLASAALCLVMTLLPVPGFWLWQCGGFFFTGCLVYFLWLILSRRHLTLPLIVGALGLAVGLVARYGRAPIYLQSYSELTLLIVFSSAILVAASIDSLDSRRIGLRLRVVGDLTYGSYLWHVPLQISVLIVVQLAGYGTGFAASRLFFCAYVTTVIAVAYVSYRRIESPARAWLRRRLLPRQAALTNAA